MSRKTKPGAPKASSSREDRLKSALKANLQRRKSQQAARDRKTTSDKEAG